MDNKIEKAIKPLLEMYEKIENELLVEIAVHFLINDEFINSDHWRIKKLEEMGLFNQDIIKYLSRFTKKSEKEIKKALNQIGIDTMNLDKLNKLFEDEVLKINPNILKNNYTIKNIINSAYNEVSERFIELSSKIQQGVREAYLNVVEEAYLKTSMGTHSYQETIRESLNNLSNKGIKVLTYAFTDEAGNIVGFRTYDVEGTARREILTAARQLSNNINLEVAEELECDYLYLSEHLECRLEHFDWQGTIIKREDLISITDYGSITGLGGINCRHYVEPYFGDARGKELKKYSLQETKEAYNLSQKQRYLERGIRKWKRKASMFKANQDDEAYVKSVRKVKEWQEILKTFIDDNDLRRDYTREYVSGYKGININLKPSKTNVENLKDSGIIAHDSLSYIDSKILNSDTKKIKELTNKYKPMKKFFEETNVIYDNQNLGDGTIARTRWITDISSVRFTSNRKYYKKYDDFVEFIKESRNCKFMMPCDDKQLANYAMTHEYGHSVQLYLFNEYNISHPTEYKKYTLGLDKDYYINIARNIKDDIIKIAKDNNPDFVLLDNLSTYGQHNAKEFFAECFANLECGKPNELGKAMGEYLKRKGMY